MSKSEKYNNFAEGSLINIYSPVPVGIDGGCQFPASWDIRVGEQWSLEGAVGSGKTLLADMIVGRRRLSSGTIDFPGSLSRLDIGYLSFADLCTISVVRDSYYQGRWHSSESESTPIVSDILGPAFNAGDRLSGLLSRFGFSGCLSKRVHMLSSGELRKLLIIRALSSNPRLLIIDHPFIGLDTGMRVELTDMLSELIAGEMQLILLLSDPAERPSFITHVMSLSGGIHLPVEWAASRRLPERSALPTYEYAIRLVDVSVRYGDHEILRNLNWSIRRGERWWLRGGNGRGKSTLLSLLYGDNPQAYANEIYLFDRRRGSGESIWELKSRIGYTSPELQRYAEDMGYLSTGERSLKLLQRVLSVHYDLLILDEPLQGVDMSSRELAKGLINRYCVGADVTLIYVTHDKREVPGCVTLVKEL